MRQRGLRSQPWDLPKHAEGCLPRALPAAACWLPTPGCRLRCIPPCCRQREALSTPLDPVERRALLEQVASLARPTWALSLAAFTQAGGGAAGAPHPPAPAPPAAGAATQPVAPHGLAF